ncbi:hypothetical protein Tco_0938234 [Tanacetum coccineum]|uniref:Uncharacterized protein n=1 Tax=Tanacetum coccineum TaxID=301880 RepID=A0ABQ5DMQ9_9ASTR
MIGDMDLIVKYMLETILHQQEIQKLLTEKKLLHTQEAQSYTVQALKVDSVIMENTCYGKENSNTEPAFNKPVKENSLVSETKEVLSKEDLKGTHTEHGFKQAFMSFFGQDDDTFTNKYFAKYTGIEVKQFRETLLQHMSNVKKFVAERTRHKRLYDRRVNRRQMLKQESKVDSGKELDASLVVTKISGTKSGKQDTSSRSGNDADADNAYIKPIYDEEPMAEVQLTAEYNIFATRQQHTEQPEIINEGKYDGATTWQRSNHNLDEIAVITNKLDSLRCDMPKLKESIHAIQVGCKVCEGVHLTQECPLKEEGKNLEVKVEKLTQEILINEDDMVNKVKEKIEKAKEVKKETVPHDLPIVNPYVEPIVPPIPFSRFLKEQEDEA